jgi:hypothetical protein
MILNYVKDILMQNNGPNSPDFEKSNKNPNRHIFHDKLQ